MHSLQLAFIVTLSATKSAAHIHMMTVNTRTVCLKCTRRKLASLSYMYKHLHCTQPAKHPPRPYSVSLHSSRATHWQFGVYDKYSLWYLPSPLSISSGPYIWQPQCCGSGSDGSVIKYTPGSGSFILLLRIRILTIYQRFKKMPENISVFDNIKWFTTNLTTHLRHQNVQVGSGSGHKKFSIW